MENPCKKKVIKTAEEQLSKEDFDREVNHVKRLLLNIKSAEDRLKDAKDALENYKKDKPGILIKNTPDLCGVSISSSTCVGSAQITLSGSSC